MLAAKAATGAWVGRFQEQRVASAKKAGAKVGPHSKPIIGLCGGIGAGKSRVAAEFEELGCLVVSSDRVNHEVLRRPAVLRRLREWWGPGVVGPDGEPERQRIAEIVFSDPGQRERLERLVHPLIVRRQAAMIRAVEKNSSIKAIVIDSPLLFESHLDRQCDTIVFVDAPEAARVRRVQRERGWAAEELRRRESWQMSLAEKRSRAAFVVRNDGPAAELRPQVADILQAILAKRS
ncbi:MAG: dephospho-CoA kinase [Planctomycetota bacterium]